MHPRTRPSLLVLLAAMSVPDSARAAASINVGPTPIEDGEAAAAGDITLLNDRVAAAIAVESTTPYGVPRGALIDLAPVVDGRPGRDRVEFADFLPNGWSPWPNTYHKVEIIDRGPEQAVVRSTRDWEKVTVESTYTLRDGADRVELHTVMTNRGDRRLDGLVSGQTLWPSGEHFFLPVPGLGNQFNGPATGALTHRSVAYGEDWIITLHAPYFDYVGEGSYDLLQKHSLDPGGSRSFGAWLQVGTRGELGPTLAAEIEGGRLASGQVRGAVTTRDGRPVDEPIVVILSQGLPYAWIAGRNGRFQAMVPAGQYTMFATAKGHTESEPIAVSVAAGTATTLEFAPLEPPGRVEFEVRDAKSGAALDARIAITDGQRPFVGYLGRPVFFTELDRMGRLDAALAPGSYRFAVTSGGRFLAMEESVQLDVHAGKTSTARVAIERLFDPASSGWYAADLHHHGEQAEGRSPPEFLARSQLAAGLDLLSVSDHDSTRGHAPLQAIAAHRGVPFLPSIELSPSWAHFNAWPLRAGEKPRIDTGTASVDEVFAEARRLGAIVVQANHPLISYGYLTTAGAGIAPGGFNPSFELLELNACCVEYDGKVMQELWRFWNEEHRYYLSGGSDSHDVWTDYSGADQQSGELRTYAHVAGALTPEAYAEAVKAGRAYVSYGPLIVPGVDFGSDLKVRPGARFVLPFTLNSVAGLRRVALIGAGQVVDSREFADAPREARVEFERIADGTPWFSVEVEDAAGRKAYSNPIWIDMVRLADDLIPKK
jgi:hypothetical protein